MKATERQPSSSSNQRSRDWDRLLKITWTLIGLGVLLVAALWLLGRLWTVLLPLLLGLVIVFFLRPPVEWMAERGLPRALAVSACYFAAFLVVAGLIALAAPAVVEQTEAFVAAIPAFTEAAEDALVEARLQYDRIVPDWAVGTVDEAVDDLGERVRGAASGVAGRLLSAGGSIAGLITGILTGLVVGFYLLYTLPRVGPGLMDAMPPGWRRDFREAGERVETTVGGFVRGQMIVAVTVGVLTGIGMSLIGMPFPLFIGLVAGLLDIVPYLGPITAGIFAALIGLFTDPMLAVWGVLVVTAVQQLETHLIGPKVMGSAVGLHPVIVILGIIAGATLFGFIGVLLAIPAIATIKALYGFYAEKHGWEPW